MMEFNGFAVIKDGRFVEFFYPGSEVTWDSRLNPVKVCPATLAVDDSKDLNDTKEGGAA